MKPDVSILDRSDVFCRDIHHSAFKTNMISLYLVRPLSNKEATLGALLGNILSYASEEYPSLKAISDKEDDLLGASIFLI